MTHIEIWRDGSLRTSIDPDKSWTNFEISSHRARALSTVDAMIADLPSLLQLSTPRIDFSDDELVVIDRKLRKLSGAEFEAPKLYAAVVAYVGEFVRRRVDGKWEMAQAGSLPAVPQIVDSTGAVFFPTRLYKLFLDSGHVPSIKSFIARTLGRH
jgi:hypothetical protein